MTNLFNSLDPYVIGLSILVVVQWAIQALRDRKITSEEWSSLINSVANQVLIVQKQQSKPTEKSESTPSNGDGHQPKRKLFKGKKHK
jgi:hypothetical protein